MEYLTERFENTRAGISKKDAYSRHLADQGYRIISEQVEKGHIKGHEQCCGACVCLPAIFLAGRTPGVITVTYGREISNCPSCGAAIIAGSQCTNCNRRIAENEAISLKKTAEACESMRKLEAILSSSLMVDHRLDWQSVRKKFALPEPKIELPRRSSPVSVFVRAFSSFVAFAFSLLEKILPSACRSRLKWEAINERADREINAPFERHALALDEWRSSRDMFEQKQADEVRTKEQLYIDKDETALIEYWARVLKSSDFPEFLPISWAFSYSVGDQRLTVEGALPQLNSLPRVIEVRYIPEQNALDELILSEARLIPIYRDTLIKIALRTIYELFQSDVAGALKTVAFNGTVGYIDRSTGQEVRPCIISVSASKASFAAMNLGQIDPLACLKGLGGTISENLAELTPVVKCQI